MSQNEAKKNGIWISAVIVGLSLCQNSFALALSPFVAICMVSETTRSTSAPKDLDLRPIEQLSRRMKAESDQSRARWILKSVNPSDSHEAVTQKILQTSAQNIIKEQLALTEIGSTLNTLQAPLESDFQFQSDEGDDSLFKVSLNAAQAKAQLEYHGAINASMEVHTSSATLKLHQQLTENLQLALTSYADVNHSSQTLGLSMSW